MKVYQRAATDVLTRDGETAVLVDGTVVRLGDLGSTLYALCTSPVDIRVLASELEARFGVPTGRSTLQATTEAVAEMVRAGVLIDE